MNKRNLRYWEFKIGIIQAVVLIGVITGSIACAFFLGLYSGQKVGFESAMAGTVANVARLPVAIEDSAVAREKGESALSEVYARLSDKPGAEGLLPDTAADGSARAIPDLETVKNLEDAPVIVKAEDEDALSDRDLGIGKAEVGEKNRDSAVVKILGESGPSVNAKADASTGGKSTLGSLLDNKHAEIKEHDEILPAAEQKPKGLPAGESKVIKEPLKLPADNGDVIRSVKDVERAPARVNAQKATITEKTEKSAGDSGAASLAAQSPQRINNGPLPKGWFAQVAAPRKHADADALAKKLVASGFRVNIENAKVRGEDYYRVLVGPEQSKAQSEQLQQQLSRESYIHGQPFVRMVK